MILQVFESVCGGETEVFLENVVLCKRWLKTCGAVLGFKAEDEGLELRVSRLLAEIGVIFET
ncbi:hypothetical protein KC19_11G092500 [Ceratodon purpureus]|uniref:Uncharacterized protein n=1 Tax=Ceratodon purpureus TaxID=3225 RepID=A0A8T0GGR8_CERPU|nr:hypothetical protein KC19_11G092500 [Ceratodon purpureus]